MLKVAGGGTVGGVVYQGTWNASTNVPTLTSSVGTKGYYYLVSTPGSTNLNGITTWNAGDWAVFDGSVWERVVGGTPSTSFTLGNTVVTLGGTTTNVGNLALANVTISSVAPTFPNNFLANSSISFAYSNGVAGNASVSLGGTNTLTLTNIPNPSLANSTITLGNSTLTLGSTTTAVGNLTLNNPAGNVVTAIPSTSITNSLLQNSSSVIGNTTVTLGSTVTAIGNLTLNNPAGNVVTAIPSTSITNTLLQNASTTLGNTALTLGSTVSTVGNLTISNVTIASGNVNVQTLNHTSTTSSNATMSTASIPLVPQGYFSFDLNGTVVKVPYYAV
jgi:hypothetical protein